MTKAFAAMVAFSNSAQAAAEHQAATLALAALVGFDRELSQRAWAEVKRRKEIGMTPANALRSVYADVAAERL